MTRILFDDEFVRTDFHMNNLNAVRQALDVLISEHEIGASFVDIENAAELLKATEQAAIASILDMWDVTDWQRNTVYVYINMLPVTYAPAKAANLLDDLMDMVIQFPEYKDVRQFMERNPIT